MPGLLGVASAPHGWLGSRPSRDEVFGEFARTMTAVAGAAERSGGSILSPGVSIGRGTAVTGGDVHVLEVLTDTEQEVLCNLLRGHVPTLIAMTGRGVVGVGRSPDRVGSRWLADSRMHLATRFLASTSPEHVDRVKAELRRRDGVAALDRMDVWPGTAPDGSPTVVVRCIDASVGLGGLRAHAIVLTALAMHARRRVRAGQRVGHAPQRLLEENRARAIASGRRARFLREDDPGRPGAGRDDRSRRSARPRAADDMIRDLLTEIGPELRNLDAGPDELAPVLLGIDLPRFGGPTGVDESMLLREWATSGDAALVRGCREALTDPEAGGPLLRVLRDRRPGLVGALLRSWQERIAAAEPPTRGPQRSQRRGRGHQSGRRTG